MDIVESCKEIIERLEHKHRESSAPRKGDTIDEIIEQQSHLKMLLDKDATICSLRRSIEEHNSNIQQLRKACSRIATDAVQERHELLQAQQRELEKYQILQLKSIAEDYAKHEQILAHRKKELAGIKKEVEAMDKNRPKHLEALEKSLQKKLDNRNVDGADTALGNNSDDDDAMAGIELTSIQEFAPYGRAAGSRTTKARAGGGTEKAKKTVNACGKRSQRQ